MINLFLMLFQVLGRFRSAFTRVTLRTKGISSDNHDTGFEFELELETELELEVELEFELEGPDEVIAQLKSFHFRFLHYIPGQG